MRFAFSSALASDHLLNLLCWALFFYLSLISQPPSICMRKGSWPSRWRRRDPSAKDPGRRRRWLTGGKRVSFQNPLSLLLSAVIFCNKKPWFCGSLPKVMKGLLKRLLKFFFSRLLSSGALRFQFATSCEVLFFVWGIQLHHLTPDSVLHIAIFCSALWSFPWNSSSFWSFQKSFFLESVSQS